MSARARGPRTLCNLRGADSFRLSNPRLRHDDETTPTARRPALVQMRSSTLLLAIFAATACRALLYPAVRHRGSTSSSSTVVRYGSTMMAESDSERRERLAQHGGG